MSTEAIERLNLEQGAGAVVRALLAWVLIATTAAVAIFAVRAPAPVPATAPADAFSAERALVHVSTIAYAPHPIGSAENERVRNYLAGQLSALSFHPQVFQSLGVESGGRSVIIGDTHDIVGRLQGTANSRAIMLMAHYDSVSRAYGAADDGAGVAAILEAARALRAGPALKNDIIILLTDGEEAGLLGANAFAASHSWMKDVGLIMNFEARGDSGPSLLFETGPNNSAVIQTVARSGAHPLGSSLFYALYKLLPNDTDFTVFRLRNIQGLNFAFGENLDAYHSPLDMAGNLSTASLQHHGSYALELARQFGAMDLNELNKARGDDIFFDWLGTYFVSYRQAWVIPGEVLATLGLFALIFLQVRRKQVRPGRLLPAVFVPTLFLLAVPGIMVAIY